MSRLARHMRLAAAGASSTTETLRVTVPESAWLGEVDEITWEGTWGGTLVAGYAAITTSWYIYFTQDDGTGRFIGVDPGPFEPALAGMTGIEVALPAGNRTAAQNGALLASTWNVAPHGTGIIATHTGSGVVDFVGTFNAAAAQAIGVGGDWLSRGAGTSAYGAQELDVPSASRQDVDWQSWCQVDTTALPVVDYRVVGMRFRGDNVRIVAATGGANGDPQGAVVRYQSVQAGGGSDWRTVWFEPGEVFTVTAGEIVWLGADGTAGGASGIFGATSQDVGWEITGGDFIFRTGAANGIATPVGPTVGALSGGNFAFGMCLQLIVQVAPFYGSGQWMSDCCMVPSQVPVPPNVVGMNSVAPGFPFNWPNISDLEIQSFQLYFASRTAAAEDQIRPEIWEAPGPMSLLTMVGDTIVADLGSTSGSTTGWVEVLSSPIGISGGGERRVTIKSASVGAAMTLGFDAGGLGNNVGRPGWPLADTVEDGEIEYLATSGETWWPFSATVPTPSPIAANSPPVFPGNVPGMYLRLGMSSGIQTVANP